MLEKNKITVIYKNMVYSGHPEPNNTLYLFSINYDLFCKSYSIWFNWLYDKEHYKCRNDTLY